MSDRTEVEEFLLKEFFSGKSFDKLVSDYMQTYQGTRRQVEKKIYKVLCEYVNSY